MSVAYGNFNDVRNPVLRNWNRLNTYLNIREKFGKDVGKNYLRRFNKREKVTIFRLISHVDQDGYENVRRSLIRTRFKG